MLSTQVNYWIGNNTSTIVFGKHGLAHRLNGAAMVSTDGTCLWYCNGYHVEQDKRKLE